MSVPASGTIRRSGGVASAIAKQIRLLNLKAVKRVSVKFDPFGENTRHIRNFAHLISSPKIALAYPNFSLKTEVVCDRSEPTVDISIIPAIKDQTGIKSFMFKSGNLTCLEIFQLINKHITVIAPPEEVVSVVQTKSEKKSATKKRK